MTLDIPVAYMLHEGNAAFPSTWEKMLDNIETALATDSNVPVQIFIGQAAPLAVLAKIYEYEVTNKVQFLDAASFEFVYKTRG